MKSATKSVKGNSKCYTVKWLVQVPKNHWNEYANQKQFFDQLGRKLGIQRYEDWYNVENNTSTLVKTYGGAGLLKKFKGSLFYALKAVYPEHNWVPWKFRTHHVPKGFWKHSSNHKLFLDWLAGHLGITTPEDWYQVTASQVQAAGGTFFLSLYDGSLCNALKKNYPDYNWQPWKFPHVSKGYWRDPNNLMSGVQEITEKLNITTLDDWYRVSNDQLWATGAGHLVNSNGGLYELLKKVYPHYEWSKDKLTNRNKKAAQRWLKMALCQIFHARLHLSTNTLPNHTDNNKLDILEDFLHPDIFYSETQAKMQLDVFIPQLKLAFEYQGQHHFYDIYPFGPQSMLHNRDEAKKAACKQHGITLIQIPYWWNKDIYSLAATIYQHFPTLFQYSQFIKPPIQAISSQLSNSSNGLPSLMMTNFVPIPTEPPAAKSSSRAHRLMLAMDWNENIDTTGWWMTEKYDGMRAIWDGKDLLSRTGVPIPVPQWFKEKLPKDLQLDGELWAGYGNFQVLATLMQAKTRIRSKISQKEFEDKKWKCISYCVFDTPASDGMYEDRLQLLRSTFDSQQEPIRLVLPQLCKSKADLDDFLKQVVERGGEGVVLRKPNSGYVAGRTSNMLKLKRFRDTEVQVIRPHAANTLLCLQTNGTQCLVKCSVDTFHNPPPYGTVITVQHTGSWTSGRLRYPYFLRIRNDLSWDDVVKQAG